MLYYNIPFFSGTLEVTQEIMLIWIQYIKMYQIIFLLVSDFFVPIGLDLTVTELRS